MLNIYRLTRVEKWHCGTEGKDVPHEERTGYYIYAETETEAVEIFGKRYPAEKQFDVTLEKENVKPLVFAPEVAPAKHKAKAASTPSVLEQVSAIVTNVQSNMPTNAPPEN
jgi:hypothetical protein